MGRRKTSAAKVRLLADGDNQITLNNLSFLQYFSTKNLQKIVTSPLDLLGLEGKVTLKIFVSGGGKHSQAEAVRHGITRVLVLRNQEDKRTLKKAGYLTRDPRVKERKKPGLKRARRAPQWSKR